MTAATSALRRIDPLHARPASAGELVSIITALLPSHTRRGIGISVLRDGVEGRFHQLRLGSVFQPIVAPGTRQVVGHEGFVRCGTDHSMSPWTLFSFAASQADPLWLVALDRLCRTLHAANYFPEAEAGQRLYLSVQPGLVAAVARDHGQVFGGILRLLGVATDRVVIQLPASLNEAPDRLRAVADSFLNRGFGLALHYTGGASVLFAAALCAPVALKIDPAQLPPATPLERLIEDCRRRGLVTILKRIEHPDAAARALATGSDLAQGYAFGRPEPRLT
jgi:EAL domain-containing protein (putative c-di-GMP-specific phosphodiesterase class I)